MSSILINVEIGNEVSITIGSVVFALSLLILGVIYSSKRKSPRNSVLLFLASFGLRLLVGVVLVFVLIYDDEIGLHAMARTASYGTIYEMTLHYLYNIFGPTLFIGKVLNAFLGAIMPFLVYDLAIALYGNRKDGEIAFLLAAFAPPLVIFSAVNLKELPVSFLILAALWSLWTVKNVWVGHIVTIVSLSILLLIRPPYFFVASSGVLVYEIYVLWIRDSRLDFCHKWIIAAFILLVATWLLWLLVRSYIVDVINNPYGVRRLFTSDAIISRFINKSNRFMLTNLVLLIVLNLFRPSPLRFFFDQHVAAFVESLVMGTWYLLVPTSVSSIFVFKDVRRIVIVYITLGIYVISSVSLLVGGDPFRHRIALFPLLYLLGVSFDVHDRQIVLLWVVMGLVFNISYIFLRVFHY